MNKKLIAILTLVMFAVTLLPMGAFAATTNTALQVKQISADDTQTLGNLRIAETATTEGSIEASHEITFTLTNGAKWDTNPTAAELATAFNVVAPVDFTAPVAGDFSGITDTSFTLKVSGRADSDPGIYVVNFASAGLSVDATNVTETTVGIELFSVQGGLTNAEVVLATLQAGKTASKALSTTNIEKRNNQEIGIVRIVENTAAAIKNNQKIELILPDGFTWTGGVGANTGNVVYSSAFGVGNPAVGTVGTTNSGLSKLEITLAAAGQSSGNPGVITIDGLFVDVKESAPIGDLVVTVGGNATTAELVLAKIEDYGYEVSTSGEVIFYAGNEETKLADFWLKELAKESILGDGRTLKMTLPEGMVWLDVPATVSPDSGTFTTLGSPVFENDRRTVVYTFGAVKLSTLKTAYKFKDFKVAVKATTAPKDVVLTLGGSAAITGEFKIGEIVKPVTVTAEASDIVIGKQGQPVGDILIKEVKAGYIAKYANGVKGNTTDSLDVKVDFGHTLSNTPTVEVVEGNLKIDKVSKSGSVLTISVKQSSTVASTIKISGAKVDVTRVPAEGDYKFKVYGSALNRIGEVLAAAPAVNVAARNALEATATQAVAEFVGAVIVTPAGENVVKPVTMTVGSTVYTISGVENDMDVAPYIKSDRTYFPVRYVANALGINDENVVWDPAQRAVTIFRANRIVQVTIGSTTMLVNGVPVTMDVAPEITAERTMLPIRFVAQGLGVNVVWDAATQTVTLN